MSRVDSPPGNDLILFQVVTYSGLIDLSGGGSTKAGDAQGSPSPSHLSPSMIVYEEKHSKDKFKLELLMGEMLSVGTLKHLWRGTLTFGAESRVRNSEAGSCFRPIDFHITQL